MGENYDNAMSGLGKRWSSRQKSGNGWLYQIASYRNADNDFFTLKILIEDGTSTAIISRSPKTTLYEFDLNGATRGTSIPYDLRVRIASDFEAVGAEYKAEQDADTRTDEERYFDSVLEAEKESGGSGAVFRPYEFTVLQEQDFPSLNIMGSMNDVKYTLERGEGARSEQGVMVEMVIYRVATYMDGEMKGSPYTTDYDNQADAETAYQEAVDSMIAQRVRLEEVDALPDIETTIMQYRGFEVTYYNDDGYSTTSDEENFYRLKKDGELVRTVYPPQVSAGRDESGEYPVNVNITIPDYNYDNPQPAIEAWELVINGRIDGRVKSQVYNVESWNYYLDNTGVKNPFEYIDVGGLVTVDDLDKDDDGRLLKMNDNDLSAFVPDFLDSRAPSGALKLRVKNGYEVVMKIATENFSYWVNNIDGLYTTGLGRTGEFVNPHPQIRGVSVGGGAAGVVSGKLDVVEITFKGGDILHIDIDDDFSKTADLKIMIDGTDYASDAANINDEVEVVIDSITYSDSSLFDDYEENEGDGGMDYVPTPDTPPEDDEPPKEPFELNGRTILIVLGGGILLAVAYTLLKGSGE